MDDKQAKKLYDESKVLKVMDRLYNGESISVDQFLTIFELIQRKGIKSTIRRSMAEYRGGRWTEKSYDTEGHRYLGMFASEEYNKKIIYYGDTRSYRIVECFLDDNQIFRII